MLLRVLRFFVNRYNELVVRSYQKSVNGNLKFVRQGEGGLFIDGDPSKLTLGYSSHFKSATFLDVRGGLSIGDYFHVGRALTVFTSDHEWRHATSIPYSRGRLYSKVIIGNYVWIGANVTILPGSFIEDCVIVGANSVVKGRLDQYGVYAGNPAKKIGMRDTDETNLLIKQGNVF